MWFLLSIFIVATHLILYFDHCIITSEEVCVFELAEAERIRKYLFLLWA